MEGCFALNGLVFCFILDGYFLVAALLQCMIRLYIEGAPAFATCHKRCTVTTYGRAGGKIEKQQSRV